MPLNRSISLAFLGLSLLSATTVFSSLSHAQAPDHSKTGAQGEQHVETFVTTTVPEQPTFDEHGKKIIKHTEIVTIENFTASLKALTMRVVDIDANGDRQISLHEIADYLFKAYDGDKSKGITPQEFSGNGFFAAQPVEIRTVEVTFKDVAPSLMNRKMSYQQFFDFAGFTRFVTPEGVTAEQFTGKKAADVDTNNDGIIDRAEWRAAYVASKVPTINRTELKQ